MDQKIKTDWVERLRSGIPQLHGHLGNTDGERCCLGVLCDLAVEAGVIRPPTAQVPRSPRLEYPGGPWTGSDTGLPLAVAKWAGISDDPLTMKPANYSDPEVAVPDREHGTENATLATLNDGGLTFEQIADVIDWAM